MQGKSNTFFTILFWGSVWGIVEATLGWAIHLIHLHSGALLLYTFGIFCMLSCASRTGKGAQAVMGTAMVAAGIKLLDLFLPMTLRGAINPAIYILLEGMLFAVLSRFLTVKPNFNLNLGSLERRVAIPTFAVAAVLTLWLS